MIKKNTGKKNKNIQGHLNYFSNNEELVFLFCSIQKTIIFNLMKQKTTRLLPPL